MAPTFVSRQEYDRLVAAYPEWMRTGWLRLDRRWIPAGVIVLPRGSADGEALRMFREALPVAELFQN